ncbi:Thyroid peroxidase [Orchesella cincta]|uniref:Thyroid peroxidase n=1 Tax=Orchesella cincta TaxID=48709 RepID=A0A1D2NFP7_ORCCI|nr:Thyroid peroxidase [Orchesella cincta]
MSSYHKPGSAAWFMSTSHKANAAAQNISRISLLSEEATHIIAQKYRLTREQTAYSLPNLDVRNSLLNNRCPLKVDFPCQPRKYRAYNGYCNNVQHPRWGSANMRYLRYLMPDYSNVIWNYKFQQSFSQDDDKTFIASMNFRLI